MVPSMRVSKVRLAAHPSANLLALRSSLPNTVGLSSWDHWPRYRAAVRHDLALYPLVGHSQTIRQRLGRLPAELFFYEPVVGVAAAHPKRSRDVLLLHSLPRDGHCHISELVDCDHLVGPDIHRPLEPGAHQPDRTLDTLRNI